MSVRGKRICKEACAVAALFILVAAVFFYSRYLDLKKTLLVSLSDRATIAAGQRVEIGDILLSSSAIDLSGITIKNPSGFAPGNLLQIKRISIRPDLHELLEGRLHLKDIEIYSPELSIVKDRQGRWNISEKLIDLLSTKKKSTLGYHIDEVEIRSGTFELNGNRRLRNEHVDARLTGLSSERGTKTAVEVETIFAGNEIKINASAYLNDEPKKFMLTCVSKGFSLSAFNDLLARYQVDTGKTIIDFSVTAEGDAEKGFDIRSDITARKASSLFSRHEAGEIRLLTDAFLTLKDWRVLVRNASLRAGRGLSVSLRGEIDDIRKAPRYRARVFASKINLSDFRFVKGTMIGGIIISDGVEVKGTVGQGLPELSGSAAFHDVYVQSDNVDVKKINGEMAFTSGRGLSIQAKTTADISKAGAFRPDKPARLQLTLSASKKRGAISFSSSATLSSLEMGTGKKQEFRTGSAILNAAGSIVKNRLFCNASIEAKNLRYSGRSVSLFRASSSVDAGQHMLLLRDLKIWADGLTGSAALVRLATDRTGGRYEIKATGLDAACPEEKAAVEGLDFSLALRRKQHLSGDIVLSAGKILYRGVEAGRISGKGNFDGESFSLEIPDADIFKGKMRLTAQGKVSGDHFPLSVTAGADNVDMERLSSAVSVFVHSPCSFSGRLVDASFEGTIASPEDITGHASLGCSGVSVARNDTKRTLARDVSASAGLTFSGRNLAFGLNVKAGTVSARFSGEVKRFAEKERTFRAKMDLPEVKAAAIRDSFWDIFPDSLLYTGLDGSISSHVEVSGGGGFLHAEGDIALKDFTLTGEDDEYSLGPVNGVIPVGYARPARREEAAALPPFARRDFEKLKKIYSKKVEGKGFSRITLGSFRYGFRLMEDITLLVKQQDGVFTIGRLSANIFGGKLNGSAVITSSGGPGYRGGVMIEGLSLKKMCDDIGPIRGYISGKVDGVVAFKGSGAGLAGLIGKGDFWTYSSGGEKMKISREFLQKIAGPSLKTYVGDRSFDRGAMSFYLDNGFVVFRTLEISNRNFFGMTDLSVKVAPFSNRIAVDQLMWSIAEAAQRAEKK